jgi:hypothetical protein
LIFRKALRSASFGEMPYTHATERNETLLILERRLELVLSRELALRRLLRLMNARAGTPVADTLAIFAERLNKDRGKLDEELTLRGTLDTSTLLTFLLVLFALCSANKPN